METSLGRPSKTTDDQSIEFDNTRKTLQEKLEKTLGTHAKVANTASIITKSIPNPEKFKLPARNPINWGKTGDADTTSIKRRFFETSGLLDLPDN